MSKVLSGPTIADATTTHITEIVIRVSQGEDGAPAAGTAWKVGVKYKIVANAGGSLLKSGALGVNVSTLSAARQTNIADLVAGAVTFLANKIAAATTLDDL